VRRVVISLIAILAPTTWKGALFTLASMTSLLASVTARPYNNDRESCGWLVDVLSCFV
jgi:hypothetical protein